MLLLLLLLRSAEMASKRSGSGSWRKMLKRQNWISGKCRLVIVIVPTLTLLLLLLLLSIYIWLIACLVKFCEFSPRNVRIYASIHIHIYRKYRSNIKSRFSFCQIVSHAAICLLQLCSYFNSSPYITIWCCFCLLLFLSTTNSI